MEIEAKAQPLRAVQERGERYTTRGPGVGGLEDEFLISQGRQGFPDVPAEAFDPGGRQQ